MKTNNRFNRGIAVVEVLLGLVFLGLLGGLGYIYFTKDAQRLANSDTSLQQNDDSEASVKEVASIESTDDLDAALKELDSLDLESSSDDASLKSIESSL